MSISEALKRLSLSVLLEESADRPVWIRKQSMMRVEVMRAVSVDFVTGVLGLYAPDFGPNSPIVKTIMGMDEKRLTRSLMRHTQTMYLSQEPSKHDAYWSAIYGRPFLTSATFEAGEIVGYGNVPLTRGVLAHEMAHGLALSKYGGMSPSAASDFSKAAEKDGPNPAEYGKVNAREDFAESVRLYVEDRKTLLEKSPRRYNVIRRLLTDDGYQG